MRSLVFNALFYLNLIGLMLLGLPCLLARRHTIQALARIWARSSVWLLDQICGTKVEFRGLHNLPAGACLIAPKHQSFFETFALFLEAPDFTFILKRELTFIPLFGWYLQRSEQIAIDRSQGSNALADAGEQARRALAEGRQVFIFPEGTRRPVGAPPRYKTGVFRLCEVLGATCVPVALNSGLFWPRRSFMRRPGTIVIEFLEPLGPGLEKRIFMEMLETRIEAATQRLVNEALGRDPALRMDATPHPGTAAA